MVPVGGRSLRLLPGEALNAALLYSIEVIIHIKPPSCLQRRSSILPGSFTNCVFLFSSVQLIHVQPGLRYHLRLRAEIHGLSQFDFVQCTQLYSTLLNFTQLYSTLLNFTQLSPE